MNALACSYERKNTCGLKGWSMDMRKSDGNFSRNFFRPPNLSYIVYNGASSCENNAFVFHNLEYR
jgi:hypothetical protein